MIYVQSPGRFCSTDNSDVVSIVYAFMETGRTTVSRILWLGLKTNSLVSAFSTHPMKSGQTLNFVSPIPERAKKNKHFSENRMKNNKVMTVFLLPNVIFWLISNNSHFGSIFIVLHKEWCSYHIKKKKKKKKKNFSDLQTLLHNEAKIGNKTF